MALVWRTEGNFQDLVCSGEASGLCPAIQLALSENNYRENVFF